MGNGRQVKARNGEKIEAIRGNEKIEPLKKGGRGKREASESEERGKNRGDKGK